MGAIVRVLSFLEQWTAEVLRNPGLMFTLVLAPFLLLFAFGRGVELGGPRPATVVVQSPDRDFDVRPLVETLDQHVEFVGLMDSLPLAERALRRGDIDAIVVVPEDPAEFVEQGRQVPVHVYTGEIDPVLRSYARAYMRDQISALNQRTIAEVVAASQSDVEQLASMTDDARTFVSRLKDARGEFDEAREQVGELREALVPLARSVERLSRQADSAAAVLPGLARTAEQFQELHRNIAALQATVERIDHRMNRADGAGSLPSDREIRELDASLTEMEEALTGLQALSPEVVSAPFRLEMSDVTPVVPSFTMYYSPGVLALLVQHLAITLGALTMSHLRLLRLTDMLQVAPVRPLEVVIGNYVSYALLTGLGAAALIGLLLFVLGVPLFGSPLLVAATLVLLILASLGIGFTISLLSSSAQQATQITMLILLGSIFFSGFAFSLEQIAWPVEMLSYLFPSTYGIRTLQDLMLRGLLREPLDLVILGVAAVALLIATVWLMRRELRPR